MLFSFSDLAQIMVVCLGLGAADDISLRNNCSPAGIRNVSVGESSRFIRGTCENQNILVCLVKALRPREVKHGQTPPEFRLAKSISKGIRYAPARGGN